LIEDVFGVIEPAFNAEILKELINDKLAFSGVEIQLNSMIEEVNQDNNLFQLKLKQRNVILTIKSNNI
jgi:NADH dehydrogenase FAD-containing subunit